VNDDELRLLIRAAIQRHMGDPSLQAEPVGTIRLRPDATRPDGPGQPSLNISFGQYRIERAADDTMCIIEPAVQCNHCGFCKCHGH
jgi:hypothetical protein